MDDVNNGPFQLLKKRSYYQNQSLETIKSSIDKKLYYYLKPSELPAPRFYDQPKIHKSGVFMRPFVSYSGSPLYNQKKKKKNIINILKAYVKDENNNA